MTHEVDDEPDDLDALRAAVDEAVEPSGQLEWDQVLQAAWDGVDHDPHAPTPRDVVDRARPHTDQDPGF